MARIALILAWVLSLLLLTACSSLQDSPGLFMFNRALALEKLPERTQFDPRFKYLRVEINGHLAYLASGTPNVFDQGVTGVWYSATGEVLRFRDGRLIAAIGTPIEWRNVVIPVLPYWSVRIKENEPLQWTRVRDVMPGYHYGVRDHLVLQRIPAPENTNLKIIDPRSLIWFEEKLISIDAQGVNTLPPARYALDDRNAQGIVYGEQCLSANLCFSWQRWPVQAAKE